MFVKPIDVPTFEIDSELADLGEQHWAKSCAWCHGPAAVGSGGTPDLRASGVMLDLGAVKKILLDGERISRGMPTFPELTEKDIHAIQHYVRHKARLALQPKDDVATAN